MQFSVKIILFACIVIHKVNDIGADAYMQYVGLYPCYKATGCLTNTSASWFASDTTQDVNGDDVLSGYCLLQLYNWIRRFAGK